MGLALFVSEVFASLVARRQVPNGLRMIKRPEFFTYYPPAWSASLKEVTPKTVSGYPYISVPFTSLIGWKDLQ